MSRADILTTAVARVCVHSEADGNMRMLVHYVAEPTDGADVYLGVHERMALAQEIQDLINARLAQGGGR